MFHIYNNILTLICFVLSDLAAIRKLLEEGDGDEMCPSCGMPFDKGKKRKLIDSCGHERCYSCMFRNEGCQLCSAPVADENSSVTKGDASELTLFFVFFSYLIFEVFKNDQN